MLVLDKSKKYVLACSFGPDSMALFDMLVKNQVNFSVAHVNYHKRDVSDFEEKSLKEICAQNNIKCYVLDTHTLLDHSGNFQAWARKVRYKFFKQVLESENGDAVLVAHHLDDYLETYKLQTQRESYVNYYGINYQTTINGAAIIRPLLKYTKSELLAYCDTNKVPYSIDVSNSSDIYARNRIRHQIIDKMSKEEKLKEYEKVEEINKRIMEERNELGNLITNNQIEVEKFLFLDDNHKTMLLDLFLKQNQVSKSLSKFAVNEIKKSLEKGRLNYSLGSVKLINEYKMIKIVNVEVNQYEITLNEPKLVENEFIRLNLTKENINKFRIQDDSFPITIRPFRSNDLSQINGINKTVSRLYINWKMPKAIRSVWPLIFDKNQKLIYVHRYYDETSLNSDKDFLIKSL